MKSYVKFAAALSGLAVMAGAASAEMIQVKGSDTIINLVQKEAEVYMQQNPAVKISVTGGGSGTGIAALLNRQCAIADASRAINAKEIDTANSAGIKPSPAISTGRIYRFLRQDFINSRLRVFIFSSFFFL